MANSEVDVVHDLNRILYVEPNDIFGEIEGVPMTPDYSDYCISVNLIAEVVTRFRQTGENSTKEYILSYSTRPGDENANKWVSFLQGEDAKKYGGDGNFLTTFYTDIDYEDVIKENIVEGLGIESVQVSFESYYTPTVVIKFVDVRGSALFGREEVVHGTGQELSSSSVFGVFFTVPYPKFRLQIKGFYGRGVTYQLTCSNFNASFNSQTGNFEAIATFIGYSYSLLTDIPLRYLVAAPYCKYIGREYWEKHLNTPEWALSNGHRPQKLFEIIKTINSLMSITDEEDGKGIVSDEQAEEKTNVGNEKSQLSILSANLIEYANAVREMTKTGDSLWVSSNEDDKEDQIIIFSNEPILDITDRLKLASKSLIESFDSYNSSNAGIAFSESLLPNGLHSVMGDKMPFVKFCDIVKTDNKITKVTFKCNSQNINGIRTIQLNDGQKFGGELAKKLYDDSREGNIKSYFGEYCHVVTLNKFITKINERLEDLNKKDKEITRSINIKLQEYAKEQLGFTPYIGDVFKIIMCHLETFIKMMWGCYKNIESSDRSASYLGIDIDNTDYVNTNKNDGRIGPWPGVFNNGKKTSQGGCEDKSIDFMAWVGDFSHNFEEEKLVLELYKAVKRVSDDKPEEQRSSELLNGIPLMPNDMLGTSSAFARIKENNLSALSGYLSFRASQLFGVLLREKVTPELAMSFGKIDAYNLFAYLGSRSDLKNKYLNAESNDSFENIVCGISKCLEQYNCFCTNTYAETGKTRHSFECGVHSIDPNYNKRDRHPVFTENSGNLRYVHYYTHSKNSLVPSDLVDYKQYADTFVYHADTTNGKYFEFNNTNEGNGFLHKSSCKTLFDNSLDVKDYTNASMFEINTSQSFSDGVVQKYNEIKSGTFKIYGDEFTDDFNNVLNKLWHVKESDYGKYFDGNSYMLSKPVTELGVKPEELYPNANEFSDNSKAPLTIDNTKWFEVKNSGITYKYDDSDGRWVDSDSNNVPVENLCIRYLQSNYPKTNGSLGWQCLFGDPFYYAQNDNVKLINGETDEQQIERQKRVKALLFLHTFKYDLKKVPEFLKMSKKSGGVYLLPYGYILLLGGLLWRRKYFIDNNVDPIQDTQNGDYKKVGIDNTLFVADNGLYRFCPLTKTDRKEYTVKVSSIFGGGNVWQPDYHITNKFISIFESFVNNEWGKIMSKLELANCTPSGNGGANGRNVKPYTYKTFCEAVSNFRRDFSFCLKNKGREVSVEDKNVPSNQAIMIKLRSGVRYFYNFVGNYRYVYANKDFPECERGLMLLFNNENVEIQNLLKDLYVRKVTVFDSCGYAYPYGTNGGNGEITIPTDSFRSYLSGFRAKIQQLSEDENNEIPAEYEQSTDKGNRDLLLPIYLYLKTLWDRWLVSVQNKKISEKETISYEDYYNVENFYNSFIFIDAFYTNIYSKLLINCEALKNSYYGRDENTTLFQFIGDIADKHRCLFLALPDYVDMGNKDNKKAIGAIKDMFRPLPYSDLNEMQNENRFVVIYSPKMSEHSTDNTGYRADYFKIWNPATGMADESLPETFKVEPVSEGNDTTVSRYGYYVPSFGVAFSRQNNHLFKTINLNMSSPLVTSASIYATSNIAMKGADVPHKVAFAGQDLYPVFSNYSYICEIEMMGDAQVQPLMYFQLMNIPMWSGVYMVFKVTHLVTPGNMVTRFSGMKLSRNPVPYNSSWFMFNPENADYDPYEYEGGGYLGGGDGSIVVVDGSSYAKYEGNAPNHFDDKDNYVHNRSIYDSRRTAAGGQVKKELISLYNRLWEEIKAYQIKNNGEMTWNVGFTSIGHGSHKPNSDHYKGAAMDLQLIRLVNGKWTGDGLGGKQKDPITGKLYFTVIDILYSLHFNEVKQCIYEQYNKANCCSQYKQYQPKCLHVAVKWQTGQNTTFFVDNGNYGNFKFFDGVLLPEFKGIASKHYKSNGMKFASTFINFQSFTQKQIEKMFNKGGNDNGFDGVSANLKGSSLSNIKYVKNRLKSTFNLSDIQFCGIAGNFVQESSFNPKASEGKSADSGRGIAQWSNIRRREAEKWLKNTYNVNSITEATLEQQTDFLIYELQHGEKNTITELKKCNTVRDSVMIFQNVFERPKESAAMPNDRIAYGNLVKKYIDSGQI